MQIDCYQPKTPALAKTDSHPPQPQIAQNQRDNAELPTFEIAHHDAAGEDTFGQRFHRKGVNRSPAAAVNCDHLPNGKGIDLLRGQGYDAKQIAAKTGLSTEYVTSVLKLMEQGEERLLSAVESGQLPITVALIIMDSPGDEQRALQESYENKELRGNKLIAVRRLIEQRRRQGKLIKGGGRGGHSKNRKDNQVSARDVMKVYQKEVDRKRLLTRKAENTSSQLLFLTEALRRLFEEAHFTTLLRAEGLDTMPKQLADIMAQKGGSHGF